MIAPQMIPSGQVILLPSSVLFEKPALNVSAMPLLTLKSPGVHRQPATRLERAQWRWSLWLTLESLRSGYSEVLRPHDEDQGSKGPSSARRRLR